jgi:ATP synthase proteolipid subunit
MKASPPKTPVRSLADSQCDV